MVEKKDSPKSNAEDFSRLISEAGARMDQVFLNASEAKNLVVDLSSDSRLNSPEFADMREKLEAIRTACDIVMTHA